MAVVLVVCSCRNFKHNFDMSDLGFLKKTNGYAERLTTSNFKAPNWIMGETTDNQFKLNVFKMIASGSNIVKCQLDVPFWDGQKCINCIGAKPYFNIETRACEACPNGVEKHRCRK